MKQVILLAFLSLSLSAWASDEVYVSKNVLRDIVESQEIVIPQKMILNFDEVKDKLPITIVNQHAELTQYNNIEAGVGINDLDLNLYHSYMNSHEVNYISKYGVSRTHQKNWIYMNCHDDQNCEELSAAYVVADAIFHNSLSRECQYLNQNAKFFIKSYESNTSFARFGQVRTYEQKDDEEGFDAVYGYGVRRKIYYNTDFKISLGLEGLPEYKLNLEISVKGADEANPRLEISENIKTCLK